jgi:hypothetical protein
VATLSAKVIISFSRSALQVIRDAPGTDRFSWWCVIVGRLGVSPVQRQVSLVEQVKIASLCYHVQALAADLAVSNAWCVLSADGGQQGHV